MNALTIKHENTNRKTYRGIRKRLTMSSFKSNGKTREKWGKLAFFFHQKLTSHQNSKNKNVESRITKTAYQFLDLIVSSTTQDHPRTNTKTPIVKRGKTKTLLKLFHQDPGSETRNTSKTCFSHSNQNSNSEKTRQAFNVFTKTLSSKGRQVHRNLQCRVNSVKRETNFILMFTFQN